MSNVVTIRLDHGKANALDRELCERLLRELDQAEKAGAAVIIAANGPIFSAGIDLFKLVEGGEANVRKFLPVAMEVFRRIFVYPRPVVAAVNGHAMAGGCVIALAADYRLMAEGSGRIGLTELAVGIPFPAVILEMARYSLPHRYFHEVIYFARTYEPREALLKGLVDEVVAPDALTSRASEVAGQLAAVPADTFRLTKMQMRRVDQLPRADVIEPETVAAWIRALADDRVRSYIDRTIRKKS